MLACYHVDKGTLAMTKPFRFKVHVKQSYKINK